MQLRVKVCCAELALSCSHVSLCAAIMPKALKLLITGLKKKKNCTCTIVLVIKLR